jgi:hypothetical protein
VDSGSDVSGKRQWRGRGRAAAKDGAVAEKGDGGGL